MLNSKIPPLLQTDSPLEWRGAKGHIFSFLQSIYLITLNFSVHKGSLRAAALTYTTVLSLVPFLAIAFSVLKGLGAQNALEPFLQNIAGDSEETISRIIDYVNNTNVKSMGAIGLLMLVVTVISLMGSIEEAFNAVCGVRETRTLQRRFSDYLSVVIIGPILLLVATSMTSSMQSQWILQWLIQNTYLGDAILLLFRFLPYLSVWIAMFFLYMFIPNTRISMSSAMLGGVIAGTAWELAQWGYFHFQVGVANYNAIYGTLAALPIFLVWIYTSWLIVLFGLEIVFAHQHRKHAYFDIADSSLTETTREELALALMIQINMLFQNAGAAPTTQHLSDKLSVPLLLLEPVLNDLAKLGYVAETAGNFSGWLPARDPSKVFVSDLIGELRGISSLQPLNPLIQIAGDVVRRGWHASQASLNGETLRELIQNKL